jgi:hypothetical protein
MVQNPSLHFMDSVRESLRSEDQYPERIIYTALSLLSETEAKIDHRDLSPTDPLSFLVDVGPHHLTPLDEW